MFKQPILHTIQRYRTLHTGKISALPLVILMTHSACNSRCAMCDIWKHNKNLAAIQFRQQLKQQLNSTCAKCVCYLNLPPRTAIA